MPVITLTCDWKNTDYYSAALKGKILSGCRDAKIIDISNDIIPFNKGQAGYILKCCYRYFPAGTIHICGIGDANDRALIVFANKQYFIARDNGLLSLVIPEEEVDTIVSISEDSHVTFPESDIFAELACSVASGKDIRSLGTVVSSFKKELGLQPVYDKSSVTGNFVHFDSYGNGITNISEDLFSKIASGRRFAVCFGEFRVEMIHHDYFHISDYEPFAVFNSLGFLETGIKYANLKENSGLGLNAIIRILFYD
ncbi:MAG: SAM-dependent chlorinase/fluorinase [Bacteroidia bacterium]|nr:SAM-dependent chlorinase/fluorinase [Bacteroidia bacterium]